MSSFGTTTYDVNGEQRYVHDIPDEDCLYRVDVSDNNGTSYGTNGLRWKEQANAATWASGLAMRWFGCTNIRVVEVATGDVVEVIL